MGTRVPYQCCSERHQSKIHLRYRLLPIGSEEIALAAKVTCAKFRGSFQARVCAFCPLRRATLGIGGSQQIRILCRFLHKCPIPAGGIKLWKLKTKAKMKNHFSLSVKVATKLCTDPLHQLVSPTLEKSRMPHSA